MFTVDALLKHQVPRLATLPLVASPCRSLLRHLFRERQFARFRANHPHARGMDLVEQLLEFLHCTWTVSEQDRENIPATGRVMIVANHPIGTLDGLVLLRLVHEVRPDVRIVANDLLTTIGPLQPCLLPVPVLAGMSGRAQINRIEQALANEEAVILFPAGEVSRLGPRGVRDRPWRKGFLRLAARAKAPILPIHIRARNSLAFYAVSAVAKPLSTLMLVNEMFRPGQRLLRLTIGGLVPHGVYAGLTIREQDKVDLFRRHVYRLGANKKGILAAERAIARPERRIILKRSIQAGEMLGRTPDGRTIHLFNGTENSPVLREIGRLREITFRAVGEGTGGRRDADTFDGWYRHLVLWSEEDLEIVGAYRLADAAALVRERGCAGLYTHSLFQFSAADFPYLENGLELGRSFIQQRYWGKRSLDALWYGVGAFLRRHPQYRYLFGPVSISNSMPPLARDLLVYFYQRYFAAPANRPRSRDPFRFSRPVADLARSFRGDDYRQDLTQLKALLAAMGSSIPTLYKQYTELCLPGGTFFLDFNVDRQFGDCIDGLVVIDTQLLKPAKRRRYIEDPRPALA